MHLRPRILSFCWPFSPAADAYANAVSVFQVGRSTRLWAAKMLLNQGAAQEEDEQLAVCVRAMEAVEEGGAVAMALQALIDASREGKVRPFT